MSQHWPLLSPYFSPPEHTYGQLSGIGCFSGKAEVPQKKQLQILTFWGSLQKSWHITPHPQYPSRPISNARFSLKHSSSLNVIIPCPEPTAFGQNLSHPICTEDTPVLPHSIYKMISVFGAETLAQFFPFPFSPSLSNPTPWG